MRRRAPEVLLAVVAALACLAAALVAGAPGVPDAAPFQRLVGGLGLGPAVDLSRCAAEYDARLACSCSLRHEPSPGACVFCPSHADRR